MSSKYPRRGSRAELPILLMGALAAGGIHTLFGSTYGRAGISRHGVGGSITDPTHAVVLR